MPACRGCGAPIVWASTAATKAMPVDAEPALAGGNVRLMQDGNVLRAEVLGPLEVELATEPLHTSHFATCPHADSFRRT